jgi:hypothetical protein
VHAGKIKLYINKFSHLENSFMQLDSRMTVSFPSSSLKDRNETLNISCQNYDRLWLKLTFENSIRPIRALFCVNFLYVYVFWDFCRSTRLHGNWPQVLKPGVPFPKLAEIFIFGTMPKPVVGITKSPLRWCYCYSESLPSPLSMSLHLDLSPICCSHILHSAFKCPERVVIHLRHDSFHRMGDADSM